MTAARRAIASLLLVASACFTHANAATAEGWRSHLPGEWLAAVEIKSLKRLEERLPGLMKPWGRPAPPLRALLANFMPGAEFADRPWAAALVTGAEGQPIPLLFLPTDDFDGFCQSLDADPAEDLAIATVGGFDIALQEFGGWVRVGLLDSLIEAEPIGPRPPGGKNGDVRLCVSSAGWKKAAEFLNTRRRGQIAAGQGRVGPWKWPQGINDALDRLALYGPLAQRLAEYDRPITIGFDSESDSDELRATIETPIATPSRPQGARAPKLAADKPIIWTRCPGPLPKVAIDLSLAWTRCRPEEVEASGYPPTEWEAFADAHRAQLERCSSASYVLHFPEAGQPVAANKVVAFTWNDGKASLGAALNATNDAWNQLLKATDSRTPTPISTTPSNDNRGWEMTVDLFESAGLDFTPELEALFDRFYGHGGKMVTRVVPSGGQEWRLVMHPSYNRPNAASPPPALAKTTLLYSEISLHRLLAWKQMVDDIGKQDDIGRRVRPPMAQSEPVRIKLTGGPTLRAEAILPRASYEAAVQYWRSKKLPIAESD